MSFYSLFLLFMSITVSSIYINVTCGHCPTPKLIWMWFHRWWNLFGIKGLKTTDCKSSQADTILCAHAYQSCMPGAERVEKSVVAEEVVFMEQSNSIKQYVWGKCFRRRKEQSLMCLKQSLQRQYANCAVCGERLSIAGGGIQILYIRKYYLFKY